MGYLLTVACYIASFSPSLAIFHSFIAHDPVRIILFFLGFVHFFPHPLQIPSLQILFLARLPAHLVARMVRFINFLVEHVPRFADRLHNCSGVLASGLFLATQESPEVSGNHSSQLTNWTLRGLNKITRQGQISVAPGVSDLHNARHMLALVCGLGMGVIAALFYTMNAFAAFSGPGTLGLPEALSRGDVDPNRAGKYLPLYYTLSAILLSLFHVTWTIMVWDTCHKIGRIPSAFVPGAAAVVSHLLVAFLVTPFYNSVHQYLFSRAHSTPAASTCSSSPSSFWFCSSASPTATSSWAVQSLRSSTESVNLLSTLSRWNKYVSLSKKESREHRGSRFRRSRWLIVLLQTLSLRNLSVLILFLPHIDLFYRDLSSKVSLSCCRSKLSYFYFQNFQ